MGVFIAGAEMPRGCANNDSIWTSITNKGDFSCTFTIGEAKSWGSLLSTFEKLGVSLDEYFSQLVSQPECSVDIEEYL